MSDLSAIHLSNALMLARFHEFAGPCIGTKLPKLCARLALYFLVCFNACLPVAARMNLGKLYETLDIGAPRFCADQPVHIGGPVESNRGFVLHTQDHMLPESLSVTHDIGLTSSIEILRDITNGIGPTHSIVSLGCAGWHAGQLESELAANVWLSMPATSDLVFRDGTHDIWKDAYEMLGVDPAHFVSDIGRA